MYTFVDPKSFWPQVPYSSLQSNQIYMAPVPATPTYLIGGTPQVVPVPSQSPAVYYNVQPNWYHHLHQHPCHPPQPCHPSMTIPTRGRTLSDDVFLCDNASYHSNPNALQIPNTLMPKRRQRRTGAIEDMSLESTSHRDTSDENCHSGTVSSNVSANFSPSSEGSSSVRSLSPHHMDDHNSGESLTHSSHGLNKEIADSHLDYSLFNVFSSSLYCALNKDPPEPIDNRGIPLKTSSPIPEEKKSSDIIMQSVSNSRKGNENSHQERSKSSWADMSEGESQDVEGNQEGQSGNRRKKFLRALEEERERQRCLVLPKHAPKMNCKFCKNNGESAQIYTKHRLHFKEKTVCPLLRLYVCRLCNSTGDFAHTIKHCPFNARFDKVAWKATFL